MPLTVSKAVWEDRAIIIEAEGNLGLVPIVILLSEPVKSVSEVVEDKTISTRFVDMKVTI